MREPAAGDGGRPPRPIDVPGLDEPGGDDRRALAALLDERARPRRTRPGSRRSPPRRSPIVRSCGSATLGTPSASARGAHQEPSGRSRSASATSPCVRAIGPVRRPRQRPTAHVATLGGEDVLGCDPEVLEAEAEGTPRRVPILRLASRASTTAARTRPFLRRRGRARREHEEERRSRRRRAAGDDPRRVVRAAFCVALSLRSCVRNGGLPTTTSNVPSGRSAVNASPTTSFACPPTALRHASIALGSASTPTRFRAVPRRRAAATRKFPVPHAGSSRRMVRGSRPSSRSGCSDQSSSRSTRNGRSVERAEATLFARAQARAGRRLSALYSLTS